MREAQTPRPPSRTQELYLAQDQMAAPKEIIEGLRHFGMVAPNLSRSSFLIWPRLNKAKA